MLGSSVIFSVGFPAAGHSISATLDDGYESYSDATAGAGSRGTSLTRNVSWIVRGIRVKRILILNMFNASYGFC